VNNSSQQKCFFTLKASALQNGQNLGWDFFARFRPKLFCWREGSGIRKASGSQVVLGLPSTQDL
jgi:hypothetical protein